MLELNSVTTYQAGVYQSRAYRQLKVLKNRILEPHGLSMMQWSVLGFIYDSGKTGVRITSLAKSLDTTQAFITNTVNTLEAKGLVVRTVDAHDKRASAVTLKPEHKQLVQKIEAAVRDELRKDLYSRVTPEELRTYVNVLIKFSE